nr:hypothetical protein [Nitrosomonas supralitoralis]
MTVQYAVMSASSLACNVYEQWRAQVNSLNYIVNYVLKYVNGVQISAHNMTWIIAKNVRNHVVVAQPSAAMY